MHSTVRTDGEMDGTNYLVLRQLVVDLFAYRLLQMCLYILSDQCNEAMTCLVDMSYRL